MFQVLEAWTNLLEAAEGRRLKLLDTGDKFRFFSLVRDLTLWMDDVIRLIQAQENPRSEPGLCGKLELGTTSQPSSQRSSSIYQANVSHC